MPETRNTPPLKVRSTPLTLNTRHAGLYVELIQSGPTADTTIAKGLRLVDARRIVECVNGHDALVAQRDALAAALADLLPHAAAYAVDKDGYRTVRNARAALALIEKGA